MPALSVGEKYLHRYTQLPI